MFVSEAIFFIIIAAVVFAVIAAIYAAPAGYALMLCLRWRDQQSPELTRCAWQAGLSSFLSGVLFILAFLAAEGIGYITATYSGHVLLLSMIVLEVCGVSISAAVLPRFTLREHARHPVIFVCFALLGSAVIFAPILFYAYCLARSSFV